MARRAVLPVQLSPFWFVGRWKDRCEHEEQEKEAHGVAVTLSQPLAMPPRAALPRRELVHRHRVVRLAWVQPRARETRLVRRIRVVLRLHAERRAPLVYPAALALDRPIQEIAGVELQPRLLREDLHHAAGLGL